jgi:hypothetical protein
LVDALALRFGADRYSLIRYEPDESLEKAFGCYPPLVASYAEELGFSHDGSLDQLISSALELPVGACIDGAVPI